MDIWIRVSKMLRPNLNSDPQHWLTPIRPESPQLPMREGGVGGGEGGWGGWRWGGGGAPVRLILYSRAA